MLHAEPLVCFFLRAPISGEVMSGAECHGCEAGVSGAYVSYCGFLDLFLHWDYFCLVCV